MYFNNFTFNYKKLFLQRNNNNVIKYLFSLIIHNLHCNNFSGFCRHFFVIFRICDENCSSILFSFSVINISPASHFMRIFKIKISSTSVKSTFFSISNQFVWLFINRKSGMHSPSLSPEMISRGLVFELRNTFEYFVDIRNYFRFENVYAVSSK